MWKKKIKRERGMRDWGEEDEFCVAILLQTKSAVLFSVVVEPCKLHARKWESSHPISHSSMKYNKRQDDGGWSSSKFGMIKEKKGKNNRMRAMIIMDSDKQRESDNNGMENFLVRRETLCWGLFQSFVNFCVATFDSWDSKILRFRWLKNLEIQGSIDFQRKMFKGEYRKEKFRGEYRLYVETDDYILVKF